MQPTPESTPIFEHSVSVATAEEETPGPVTRRRARVSTTNLPAPARRGGTSKAAGKHSARAKLIDDEEDQGEDVGGEDESAQVCSFFSCHFVITYYPYERLLLRPLKKLHSSNEGLAVPGLHSLMTSMKRLTMSVLVSRHRTCPA